MITTENKAIAYAEKLVKEFAERHKDVLEQNRKNGDSFGITCGKSLDKELKQLRELYLSNVAPVITRTTNYLNIAIIRFILSKS